MGAAERSTGQPCDESADYSFFDGIFTLNNDHELWLSGNVFWGAPFDGMKVHGTIVIPPGASLTIDGPRIQFASSLDMLYRSGIVVRPGGHLVLKGNAILTSLDECPSSLWEGISVMGTGMASEASGLQGTLDIDHATISNAFVGAYAGYCNDMSAWYFELPFHSGGIIRCQDARFLDNWFGAVLRPYNHIENGGETACHFYRCTFSTSHTLNQCFGLPPFECGDFPHTMLHVVSRGHLRIGGCTFENDYHPDIYPDPTLWGNGIYALNTSISILPLCDGEYTGLVPCEEPSQRTINAFRGLYRAARIESTSPDKYAEVVRSSFSGCMRSLELIGVSHSTVVRNLVHVPLDPGNILLPRGISFANSTGFEVQENEIGGPVINDFSQPNTGMWFSNTGGAPNMFYNNRFRDRLTVGTIIQGTNDGDDPGDGLQIKCNNYGFDDLPNQYDLAFTGNEVSIGDMQGASFAPTGNTFSPTCELDESAMWVQNGAIEPFTYYHHDPNSTAEIVYPVCRSIPPLEDNMFFDTGSDYDGLDVCLTQTDLFTDGGGGVVVLEAEENHNLLKQVYDAERDGGDTEGLKDHIDNTANSSYDVRNQLMLCAPHVSSEVWAQVFARDPAMNPWHMAQALLANVPLQPEVLRMLDESDLEPYYQQLVRGAQGNGINQLTIMEGEMGHWLNRRERALNSQAMDALKDGGSAALQAALEWDEDHPQAGLPLNRLGLLMAHGDLTEAKDIVDDLLLASEPDAGIEVLGIYLDLLIDGQSIYDLSTSDHASLQAIANTYGPGQGQAQAWLEYLGEGPFDDEMILPEQYHMMQIPRNLAQPPIQLLAAYPNPSDGKQPVYMVVRMPEGMDQASLRVVDPAGRLVREVIISRNTSIIELLPSELTNGPYVAGLFAGELQLGAAKFMVVR